MYGRRKILDGTTKTLFKILATFCILSLPLNNNNNQARMYFFKIILCLSYFFRLSLGHMRISMCWAWVVSLSGSCFVFLITMNLPTANFCWRHFDDKMFSWCTVMELSRFQTRSVSHFRDPKKRAYCGRCVRNKMASPKIMRQRNCKWNRNSLQNPSTGAWSKAKLTFVCLFFFSEYFWVFFSCKKLSVIVFVNTWRMMKRYFCRQSQSPHWISF